MRPSPTVPDRWWCDLADRHNQPGNPEVAAALKGVPLTELADRCSGLLANGLPLAATELLLDDMARFHRRRVRKEAA
jgi:hypothetical protein